jgi:hypothetical protein
MSLSKMEMFGRSGEGWLIVTSPEASITSDILRTGSTQEESQLFDQSFQFLEKSGAKVSEDWPNAFEQGPGP